GLRQKAFLGRAGLWLPNFAAGGRPRGHVAMQYCIRFNRRAHAILLADLFARGGMATHTTALALVASVAMVAGMNTAKSAELKVLASPGVKEVLLDLVPAFERASGHKVTLLWGGNDDIVKRVRAGETADLVILARANIDKLVADGKL